MNLTTNTKTQKPLLLLSTTTSAQNRLDLNRRASGQEAFTVKIVLTMTLKARDTEHAQILAEHVAAFVPEDADRLTEAFSPILAAPDDAPEVFTRNGQPRSSTQAEVVVIVPGLPG